MTQNKRTSWQHAIPKQFFVTDIMAKPHNQVTLYMWSQAGGHIQCNCGNREKVATEDLNGHIKCICIIKVKGHTWQYGTLQAHSSLWEVTKCTTSLSITDLSTRLEDNSYYIPEDPNFPLFDAFTIEFDHAKKLVILWVLQVTTSRRHGGFRWDTPLKKRKTATGEAAPQLVRVRYLLVVPKDESWSQDLQKQWQFPKGWSQNCKKNDHRGKVYCLEVPLTLWKELTQDQEIVADEEDHNETSRT